MATDRDDKDKVSAVQNPKEQDLSEGEGEDEGADGGRLLLGLRRRAKARDSDDEDEDGSLSVASDVSAEQDENSAALKADLNPDDGEELGDEEEEDGPGDEEDDDTGAPEDEAVAKKKDVPYAVPRSGAFYMHDDRFSEDAPAAATADANTDSAAARAGAGGGPKKLWTSGEDSKPWLHDKFEELKINPSSDGDDSPDNTIEQEQGQTGPGRGRGRARGGKRAGWSGSRGRTSRTGAGADVAAGDSYGQSEAANSSEWERGRRGRRGGGRGRRPYSDSSFQGSNAGYSSSPAAEQAEVDRLHGSNQSQGYRAARSTGKIPDSSYGSYPDPNPEASESLAGFRGGRGRGRRGRFTDLSGKRGNNRADNSVAEGDQNASGPRRFEKADKFPAVKPDSGFPSGGAAAAYQSSTASHPAVKSAQGNESQQMSARGLYATSPSMSSSLSASFSTQSGFRSQSSMRVNAPDFSPQRPTTLMAPSASPFPLAPHHYVYNGSEVTWVPVVASPTQLPGTYGLPYVPMDPGSSGMFFPPGGQQPASYGPIGGEMSAAGKLSGGLWRPPPSASLDNRRTGGQGQGQGQGQAQGQGQGGKQQQQQRQFSDFNHR